MCYAAYAGRRTAHALADSATLFRSRDEVHRTALLPSLRCLCTPTEQLQGGRDARRSPCLRLAFRSSARAQGAWVRVLQGAVNQTLKPSEGRQAPRSRVCAAGLAAARPRPPARDHQLARDYQPALPLLTLLFPDTSPWPLQAGIVAFQRDCYQHRSVTRHPHAGPAGKSRRAAAAAAAAALATAATAAALAAAGAAAPTRTACRTRSGSRGSSSWLPPTCWQSCCRRSSRRQWRSSTLTAWMSSSSGRPTHT